jgi:outer membrane protein insertion porin family
MKKTMLKIILFMILLSLPAVALITPDNTNLESIVKSFSQLETTKKTAPKKTAKKSTLLKIEIKGHKQIPEKLILNELGLKKGALLTPVKISLHLQNLKSLGVFQDISHTLKSSPKGQILTIHIKENPVLNKIKFSGNLEINNTELKKIISSKENTIFNFNTLRKDIQAIEDLYKEKGYFLAKVYKTKIPENKNKNLTFFIGEGILDDIMLIGNRGTKDYVILREITSKRGQPLKTSALKKDLKNIFGLNYFSELVPDFLPGKEPSHYILKLTVTEKSPSSLNFGGGYGNTSGLFVYADVYWDNIYGSGQLVSLKGQFARSFKTSTYQFKYHNPWMWEKRKSFTFRAWHTNGEQSVLNQFSTLTLSYRNEIRNGADVTFGLPLTDTIKSSHKLKIENINVTEDSNLYSIQSYTPFFAYDTRDVWFNPLEGDYHTLSIEKGFKLKADSLDFIKTDIGLRKFFKTTEKQTLAARLDFGFMSGELEDTEIYYVGGVNTVRGYNDLTPYSSGDKRLLASLEYRISFNDMFQGVLFLDAGLASNNIGYILALSQGYRIGKGFGLRINTPMGPFRIDFGLNDQGNMHTHFNMGHAF